MRYLVHCIERLKTSNQRAYNVILRRARSAIVDLEKLKFLNILSVYL